MTERPLPSRMLYDFCQDCGRNWSEHHHDEDRRLVCPPPPSPLLLWPYIEVRGVETVEVEGL